MTYATRQGMIDRFGEDELIQLTDRATPTTDMIDDTVLNAALNDADSEINSYIQARYPLPLASIPLQISRIARDIARYYLYDDSVTETVEKRYKEALKTLEQIAKGIVHLGLDPVGDTTPSSASPETSANAPVFSQERLAGYR